MSKKKKIEFTEKHLEAIADKTVMLVFSIFGTFQGRINGKITGRMRNRFKQFVFVPTFPFMTFAFSIGDVENIEFTDQGIVVVLNEHYEPPKRKRKKKKASPVVAAESEMDLNKTEAATVATNPNE